MRADRPPCRDAALHHPDEPTGYVSWMEWAAEMFKTHEQKRCPGCGRFAVWRPRDTALIEGERSRD